MTAIEHERRFDVFGSHARVLVGDGEAAGLPSPEISAIAVEALMRTMHTALTRFDPASELCALNADPGTEVAASPLMLRAVQACLRTAEITDGLVDPTLVDEIERAGYVGSRVGVEPADLADAVRGDAPRRPAEPRPEARWREISVDPSRGIVKRPPGVRLDTGGSGKGLAADLAANRLGGYALYAVDVGGDIRFGGEQPAPREVSIAHPLEDEAAFAFDLEAGAVATSGLATRIWRHGDGFAHHLLDPATGMPAWTGVIQATAIAPSAVDAEALAKAALLSGPEGGAEVLAAAGGALVLDDGSVRVVGPIAGR